MEKQVPQSLTGGGSSVVLPVCSLPISTPLHRRPSGCTDCLDTPEWLSDIFVLLETMSSCGLLGNDPIPASTHPDPGMGTWPRSGQSALPIPLGTVIGLEVGM